MTDVHHQALAKLKRLAKKHGAEIIYRGNGHVQIKGKLLVNYYPDSRLQSAYIAGTTAKYAGITPEKAIELSISAPPVTWRLPRKYKSQQAKKWKKYLLRRNPFCKWCNAKLDASTATLEHIIPRARGGLDNMNNFALACEKCNQERGHNMPELKK